jgi:hypothetical protein
MLSTTQNNIINKNISIQEMYNSRTNNPYKNLCKKIDIKDYYKNNKKKNDLIEYHLDQNNMKGKNKNIFVTNRYLEDENIIYI